MNEEQEGLPLLQTQPDCVAGDWREVSSLPGPSVHLLMLPLRESDTTWLLSLKDHYRSCVENTLDRAGWNPLSQEGQTQRPNDICSAGLKKKVLKNS